MGNSATWYMYRKGGLILYGLVVDIARFGSDVARFGSDVARFVGDVARYDINIARPG